MKTNIGYFTTLIVWMFLGTILHACGGGGASEDDAHMDAPNATINAPQCAASGACR